VRPRRDHVLDDGIGAAAGAEDFFHIGTDDDHEIVGIRFGVVGEPLKRLAQPLRQLTRKGCKIVINFFVRASGTIRKKHVLEAFAAIPG
jgi:hypothetical protein